MTYNPSEIHTAVAALAGVVSRVEGAFLSAESEIRGFCVAMVAQENMLLLGPPGTAKSDITEALSEAFGLNCWRYLLGKGTTPDDLMGSLDLAAFKATGEQKRDPRGSLREAEVLFLDEVFKGSNFILNSLLTALCEKLYLAKGERERLPLQVCVGASNELPGGRTDRVEPSLRALYDRFPLKYWVDDLSIPQRANLIEGAIAGTLGAGAIQGHAPVSPEDVAVLRAHAFGDAPGRATPGLPWSEQAKASLREIDFALKGVVRISPRSLVKTTKLVRAAAAIEGAPEVLPEHLTILADVLWDTPDQRPQVRAAVMAQSCPDYESAVCILDACHAAMEPVAELLPRLLDGTADLSEVHSVSDAHRLVTKSGREMANMKGHAVEALRREARDIWRVWESAQNAWKTAWEAKNRADAF